MVEGDGDCTSERRMRRGKGMDIGKKAGEKEGNCEVRQNNSRWGKRERGERGKE